MITDSLVDLFFSFASAIYLYFVSYHFRDLFNEIELTFCDKSDLNDPGFTLNLSQEMNYDQIANAVANHLGTDPYKLQFFKCQG